MSKPMSELLPIHLQRWIDEHRNAMLPPVGNKCVWQDQDFIIMVVAGPNKRGDFHVDPYAEFFYQLQGDIVLSMIEEGKRKKITIHEGEIFLLPAHIPHSLVRPANTIGLVIEKIRKPTELDGFQWYCNQCEEKLYEEFVHILDIKEQLPLIFANFYNNPQHTLCKNCGAVAKSPD